MLKRYRGSSMVGLRILRAITVVVFFMARHFRLRGFGVRETFDWFWPGAIFVERQERHVVEDPLGSPAAL